MKVRAKIEINEIGWFPHGAVLSPELLFLVSWASAVTVVSIAHLSFLSMSDRCKEILHPLLTAIKLHQSDELKIITCQSCRASSSATKSRGNLAGLQLAETEREGSLGLEREWWQVSSPKPACRAVNCRQDSSQACNRGLLSPKKGAII